MALRLSQFPVSIPGIIITPKTTVLNTPKFSIITKHPTNFPKLASKLQSPISKAPKSSQEQENSTEPTSEQEKEDEMTELGMQIKQAMKEKDQNEEANGFVNGVVEEIREIEWPGFDKVLGTTGVVLGVIAGSSVVLLTVNAVLAEISDRIFAGKGIQDFFG